MSAWALDNDRAWHHASSRVKPRLAPGCAWRAAAELDPVVQPVGPILPELNGHGDETIACPVGRARYGPDRELGHVERDRLLEGHAAFERRRLLAGPGADLGEPGAGREIGVGRRVLDPLDRPAQPHLAVEGL